MSHKKNAKHITKITAKRPSQHPASPEDLTPESAEPAKESAKPAQTPKKTAKNPEKLTQESEKSAQNPEKTTAKSEKLNQKSEKSTEKSKKSKKPSPKPRKSSKKSSDTPEKPLKSLPVFVRPFVGFGRYVRDSWRELRSVRWPNRKATWKMTLAVLIYCAIFMVFILLLDMFFSFISNLLITK